MGTSWPKDKVTPKKESPSKKLINTHNKKDLSKLAEEPPLVTGKRNRRPAMIGNYQARKMIADRQEESISQPAQTNAEEMAAMQETSVNRRTSLAQLHSDLKVSKRGGVHISKESKYCIAVNNALESINSAMSSTFTQDMKENQRLLIDMEHLYQTLIEECKKYTARNPITSEGKRRKALVMEIQSRACSDLVALSAIRTDFCFLPIEEQSRKTWSELLEQARTIHLTVKDFAALGKAEGGQASEVYKMTGENATIKNAAGEVVALGDMRFFKPEDEYDMTQQTNAAKVVENVIKRYPKLKEKEKKNIRKWAMSTDKNGDSIPSGLSELEKTVITAIQSNLNGVDTTTTTLMPLLELDKDEKVNMTKRNVATSRVAGLLGLGHLVAKSEMAEIYDEATGHTFHGNLMEKAKGEMSGNDFNKKQKAGRKNGNKDITVNVTGEFQRDMCNLQVLDVICGQMDRHAGNFFVSTNDIGELLGLQGIDNDAAFGRNKQVTSAKLGDRHDRAVYDTETGEMILPYMDKNLAERIIQIEPEMITFALKDLLKDDEIKGVIKRLNYTKAAINKTLKEQPERFLEDKDWNDDTAQDMINQAWEKYGEYTQDPDALHAKYNTSKTAARQNYFGKFILGNFNFGYQGMDIGKGDAPQILRRQQKVKDKTG